MLTVNNTRVCVTVVVAMSLTTATSAEVTRLENRAIRVEVNNTTGCFTVTEKVTGHTWRPDPWEGAAAVLRVWTEARKQESWNLSKCRKIEVTTPDKGCVQVTFRSPVADDGQTVGDASVTTRLRLVPETAEIECRVSEVKGSSGYFPTQLEFPARHFSLRSEVDRGMAVIPYHSGVVVPSYLFPRPSSQFGEWTDWHHQAEMIFEFRVYGHLRMPWCGIHASRSGVMTLLPSDGSVNLQYIQNYNDRARVLKQTGKESAYPNILALSPVWQLQSRDANTAVRYACSTSFAN